MFHADALVRADECLKRYGAIIAEAKPDRVLAMATSAARDASNKDELFKIAERHAIPLEIIPGEKEAQITYSGAVSAASAAIDTMVIDIGGGSTEIIFGRGSNLIQGKSFDIGCVRLTEKYITAQPTSIKDIMSATSIIDRCLQEAESLMPQDFSPEEIIAVAGTPTSLAAAEIGEYNASLIDGYSLNREKLNDWFLKLTKATVAEKVAMGIPSGRADVILIGVIILLRTLIIFDKPQLSVSTRGVRYGVALEIFNRS
jgi:exopolyphosphatase/guanosine-5'-triphosphate,3'-diphosphate pyrophosphatase